MSSEDGRQNGKAIRNKAQRLPVAACGFIPLVSVLFKLCPLGLF